LLRSIEKSTMAHIARIRGIFVLAAFTLAACVGAPVQEMSNARQAIRAARDAGAEDSLERRAYREARRSAIAARDKAAEALGATQPGSNTG
jgi:hypothetical protein